MRIRRTWAVYLGVSTATALLASSASAAPWAETGDAGSLPSTAQVPAGSGSLDSISGTISGNMDQDVYTIFIPDPSQFSAVTTGGDPPDQDDHLDAILALFDEDGLGIFLNDDAVEDNGNAALPALPSGSGPGVYFLAIADDDVLPISDGGLIFPDPVSPFTAILDPTGPGGDQPIIDWGTMAMAIDFADGGYTITLEGAVFLPEPSALALSALALLGFLARRPSPAV